MLCKMVRNESGVLYMQEKKPLILQKTYVGALASDL